MKSKVKLRFENLPRDYVGLCRMLLPRPIRDQVDYSNITEITDIMALWQADFTKDQRDYFDLLCGLLEQYDAENVKWPKSIPRDILQHLLAENDLSAAD